VLPLLLLEATLEVDDAPVVEDTADPEVLVAPPLPAALTWLDPPLPALLGSLAPPTPPMGLSTVEQAIMNIETVRDVVAQRTPARSGAIRGREIMFSPLE
jgi:hypothetical protein